MVALLSLVALVWALALLILGTGFWALVLIDEWRNMRVRKIIFTLFVFTLLAFIAGRASAQPRIPATAAALALAEVEQLPPTARPFTRFIWLPAASDAEFIAAAVTLNTAVNQSSVEYEPPRVAAGALVRVDLAAMADDEAELNRLLWLWNSLSKDEPWFHVTLAKTCEVDCAEFVHTDGKKYKRHTVDKIHVAAPHLGPLGPALENAVGNLRPDVQSFAPVLHVGWFTEKLLSSIDGGKYLQFRGLKVGHTTLEEYLTSRGASLEQAKNLDAAERAVCMSNVTGKPRGIWYFYSAGVRPSTSIPLVAVTDDPFDNNKDPEFDAFLELLNPKSNGHEVMVTLPTGWIEWTLFDGNGKLVAEAPQNLVSDRTVPHPNTTRLHGAMCIRCHGGHGWWQPFRNQIRDMADSKGRVLTDISGGVQLGEQFNSYRKLQLRYGAANDDVISRFNDARDAIDKRIFAVTGHDGGDGVSAAKHAAEAMTAIHDTYVYQHIDAITACKELGFAVPPDDPLGTKTIARVLPASHPEGLAPELGGGLIGRLHSEFFDPATKKREGLKITRRQWERLLPLALSRAMPLHEAAAREAVGNGDARSIRAPGT